MSDINVALKYMLDVADDDTHGYSMTNRNGDPDFDCSSLLIKALREAGFPMEGATYTGNMSKVLQDDGFKDVKNQIVLSTGKGLVKGDVLLYHDSKTGNGHTAMYAGDGKIVHARSAYGNPQAGDQSGNEISVSNYYNKPWTWVYRAESTPATDKTSVDVYTVVKGDTLNKICKKFGVSLADLLLLNPSIKNPNLITVGQKITITNNKKVRKFKTTAQSGLNIRINPNKYSTSLGLYPLGTAINVVSIENGWAKMDNGYYVSADWIKEV